MLMECPGESIGLQPSPEALRSRLRDLSAPALEIKNNYRQVNSIALAFRRDLAAQNFVEAANDARISSRVAARARWALGSPLTSAVIPQPVK
jgi:hypothetical protein